MHHFSCLASNRKHSSQSNNSGELRGKRGISALTLNISSCCHCVDKTCSSAACWGVNGETTRQQAGLWCEHTGNHRSQPNSCTSRSFLCSPPGPLMLCNSALRASATWMHDRLTSQWEVINASTLIFPAPKRCLSLWFQRVMFRHLSKHKTLI